MSTTVSLEVGNFQHWLGGLRMSGPGPLTLSWLFPHNCKMNASAPAIISEFQELGRARRRRAWYLDQESKTPENVCFYNDGLQGWCKIMISGPGIMARSTPGVR